MSIERLSQRDIDSLLRGSEPDAPQGVGPDVVPYNFIRPPRVSKDRRTTLQAIYTSFALNVQALLSSRLRSPLDVVVSSIEQATFGEFLLSLGSPCAAFVFATGGPAPSHGVLDVGSTISEYLVDRLFGGPGEPTAQRRPLTQLETVVVRSLVERTMVLLREAWKDHLRITGDVVGFESDPDALQITSREDNVLITNLEIRAGTMRGFMTVCLPMTVLEPFLQEAVAGRRTARPGSELAASRALVNSGLQHAHLSVSARFREVWMPARALAQLQVGQVLPTRQTVDGPVEIHVNGKLRFAGKLGQVRKRVAVHITQSISATSQDGRHSTRRES